MVQILKVLINRVALDPVTNKPYGIVYRDISPGNVLLSFEGNIKLSDFGIAKTADDLNTKSRGINFNWQIFLHVS